MGRSRIEYTWGQEIGRDGVIFLEELEGRKLPSGVVERRVKVQCPICKESFQTDLRRITRTDSPTKKAIKMCPQCSKIKTKEKRQSQIPKNSLDLIGQEFGDFIVIAKSEKRKNHSVYWICKCKECGILTEILGLDLKRRHRKYCHNPKCPKKEQRSVSGPGSHRDLTGKTFGKWTVLELSYKNEYGEFYYLCECSCPAKTRRYVQARNLRNYRSQSCGCKKTSSGEDKIMSILDNLNIDYKYDTSELNCINPKTDKKLRFDFYLPDYNCCIEYDGEQHYKECDFTHDSLKDRQYRDNVKNKYCEDNKIKLIRIPYFDFDLIDSDYILRKIK